MLSGALKDAIRVARPHIEQTKSELAAQPPWYEMPDKAYRNEVLDSFRMCVLSRGSSMPKSDRRETRWAQWDSPEKRKTFWSRSGDQHTQVVCEYPFRFQLETITKPGERFTDGFHAQEYEQRLSTLCAVSRILENAGLRSIVLIPQDGTGSRKARLEVYL